MHEAALGESEGVLARDTEALVTTTAGSRRPRVTEWRQPGQAHIRREGGGVMRAGRWLGEGLPTCILFPASLQLR